MQGSLHPPLRAGSQDSSSEASLYCCSVFVTPWTIAHQASLSFTISRGLLKFMSIEWVMLSNHIILCCPLLLLPSVFPSIRVFSNEWALHIRWLNYWSFSFSINPYDEYSRLISFRTDLLAVQEAFLIHLQMTLHPWPCLLYSQHSASSAFVLLWALICLSFQIIRCHPHRKWIYLPHIQLSGSCNRSSIHCWWMLNKYLLVNIQQIYRVTMAQSSWVICINSDSIKWWNKESSLTHSKGYSFH